MDPVNAALTIYLLIVLLFLIPTYVEGVTKKETSLRNGILSILCCALWPLLLTYVAILRNRLNRA